MIQESLHCGSEYEKEYSALIETHTATSIDSAQQKSTDGAEEESVESNQGEWENNYYNPTTAATTCIRRSTIKIMRKNEL